MPCLPACKHCNGELCNNGHVSENTEAIQVEADIKSDDCDAVVDNEKLRFCNLLMDGGYTNDWSELDVLWVEEEIGE